MVEASYAGCEPLVPARLAYPEIYPDRYRFATTEELVARLRAHIMDRPAPGGARSIAEQFTLERLALRYEELFVTVAAMTGTM
jgi:hypothetical protein